MKHTAKTEAGTGRSRKRRVRIIIIVVLLLLLGGLGWVAFTQRNNLGALYLALTSNPDNIAQLQQDQDKKQEDLLNQYGLHKPDLGQISTQEPVLETQAPAPEASQPQPSQDAGGSSGSDANSQQQAEAQAWAEIQGYVNQLYQVEAKYQGYLSGVVADAKAEFLALPKEQRTQQNKISIVWAKADTLIAQEKNCDAEVEGILSNIQAVLNRIGDSSNLVSEIRAYYENSKANWKAAKMTELYS